MPPTRLTAIWVSEECEEEDGDVGNSDGEAAADDAEEEEVESIAGEDVAWPTGNGMVAIFPEASVSNTGL